MLLKKLFPVAIDENIKTKQKSAYLKEFELDNHLNP